jgi:hypothetical protein
VSIDDDQIRQQACLPNGPDEPMLLEIFRGVTEAGKEHYQRLGNFRPRIVITTSDEWNRGR